MTCYRPCYGCVVDASACHRRAEVSEAIRGLHITSVKFRCVDRTPQHQIGQRVSVTWVLHDDGADFDDSFEATFYATVLREASPGKFLIKVDDGPSVDDEDLIAPDCLLSERGFAKVSGSRLTPITGPALASVCPTCDAIGPEYAECFKSGYFSPRACAKSKQEAAA